MLALQPACLILSSNVAHACGPRPAGGRGSRSLCPSLDWDTLQDLYQWVRCEPLFATGASSIIWLYFDCFVLFGLSECTFGAQLWLWIQRRIQRGYEEKVCPYYAFCGWISQRCGQSAWSLWRPGEEWIDPWGEMMFGTINASHMQSSINVDRAPYIAWNIYFLSVFRFIHIMTLLLFFCKSNVSLQRKLCSPAPELMTLISSFFS